MAISTQNRAFLDLARAHLVRIELAQTERLDPSECAEKLRLIESLADIDQILPPNGLAQLAERVAHPNQFSAIAHGLLPSLDQTTTRLSTGCRARPSQSPTGGAERDAQGFSQRAALLLFADTLRSLATEAGWPENQLATVFPDGWTQTLLRECSTGASQNRDAGSKLREALSQLWADRAASHGVGEPGQQLFRACLKAVFPEGSEATAPTSVDAPSQGSSLPQLPPAATRLSGEAAAAARELATYQHVVIDARAFRQGNGDVAAGFSLAGDLMTRLAHPGPMTLLVNEKGLGVLSKMTGQAVADGTELWDGALTVRVEDGWSFGSEPIENQVPADLLIAVAQRTDGHYSSPQTVVLTSDAVVCVQPVLGATESGYMGRQSKIQIGEQVVEGVWPGVGTAEGGIYCDPVALALRHCSREDCRDFVLEHVDQIAHQPSRKAVEAVLSGRALGNATLGFVYGIGMPAVYSQFNGYLAALQQEADQQQKPFVILTSSTLMLEHVPEELKKSIVHINAMHGEQVPETAEPGRIYVVELETVTDEVFVGMMAASELPPVVSGDSSLSAAVTLQRPFLMTRVRFNAHNVVALGRQLLAAADDSQHPLIVSLFGDMDFNPALQLLVPESQALFAAVTANIGFFSDRLLSSVGSAKTVLADLDVAALAEVPDPVMRVSLAQSFDLTQPEVVEALVPIMASTPAQARGFFQSLSPEMLKNEVVRRTLEGPLLHDRASAEWAESLVSQLGDDRSLDALLSIVAGSDRATGSAVYSLVVDDPEFAAGQGRRFAVFSQNASDAAWNRMARMYWEHARFKANPIPSAVLGHFLPRLAELTSTGVSGRRLLEKRGGYDHELRNAAEGMFAAGSPTDTKVLDWACSRVFGHVRYGQSADPERTVEILQRLKVDGSPNEVAYGRYMSKAVWLQANNPVVQDWLIELCQQSECHGFVAGFLLEQIFMGEAGLSFVQSMLDRVGTAGPALRVALGQELGQALDNRAAYRQRKVDAGEGDPWADRQQFYDTELLPFLVTGAS